MGQNILSKIAKKNIVIDFELFKTLKITKSQAIILAQINHFNSYFDITNFKKKDLAQCCNIARSYFHKCLKVLESKNLIRIEDKEIFVTNDYKKIQKQCYENEHSHRKTKSKIANFHNDLQQEKESEKKTKKSLFQTKSNYIDTSTQSLFSFSKKKEDIVFLEKTTQDLKAQKLSNLLIGFDSEKIRHALQKEIETANSINLSINTLRLIRGNQTLVDKLEVFFERLKQARIITIPANKQELINDIETLSLKGSLEKSLDFSNQNGLLWLCESEVDSHKSIERLELTYNMIQEAIKAYEQTAIHEALDKYQQDITRFLEYRKSKNRPVNSFAFKSLCLAIKAFDLKGRNITHIINQSIERGYNWIFDLTHKKRFYKKYKRVA